MLCRLEMEGVCFCHPNQSCSAPKSEDLLSEAARQAKKVLGEAAQKAGRCLSLLRLCARNFRAVNKQNV